MLPLRLGLFGGTFDPPHLGHLVVAQAAVDQLSLDRLVFVVAGNPPHKAGVEMSPGAVRTEMTRAAVAGNPAFDVSEIELGREGPSYTVDTLRLFRAARPEARLFFLLGADQLAEFQDWQEPEEVARLTTLVAVGRGGAQPGQVAPPEFEARPDLDFLALPVTRLDISSSEIRGMVRAGRSVRYLVPDQVNEIIETHRLYRPIS